MNFLQKLGHAIVSRIYEFFLNQDRAAQGLILDQGVDKTISGEAAVIPGLKPLDIVLDATLPGGSHGKHSENAAYDDEAQQKALNEAEGNRS